VSQLQSNTARLPVLAESTCPEWCEGEHLGRSGDPRGFHHDGPVTGIPLLHQVVPGTAVDLYVNASEHACAGEAQEPAVVEIQDDRHTLALLTPAEAICLAEALIATAAVVSLSTVRVRPPTGRGAAADEPALPWSLCEAWVRAPSAAHQGAAHQADVPGPPLNGPTTSAVLQLP
jgi:hypothetical protein